MLQILCKSSRREFRPIEMSEGYETEDSQRAPTSILSSDGVLLLVMSI